MDETDLDPLDEYLDSTNLSYYTDEELEETPAERLARIKAKLAPEVPKGHCRKCGQHIGKGIHLHEKACAG